MIEVKTNYYIDQTKRVLSRSVMLSVRGGTLSMLREETVNALIENGHTARDVDYVSTSVSSCSWRTFCDISKGYFYHDLRSAFVVNQTLKIVGKDGWYLERKRIDDAEKWAYKSPPAPDQSPRQKMETLQARDLDDVDRLDAETDAEFAEFDDEDET